jgi:hypothetical protein
LKAQLSLQQSVEELAVLAAVGIVYTVIRTHQISSTGKNSVLEGPQVEFVHGFVIDIGRNRLDNVSL